jgi:hypothetical protein
MTPDKIKYIPDIFFCNPFNNFDMILPDVRN